MHILYIEHIRDYPKVSLIARMDRHILSTPCTNFNLYSENDVCPK